MESAQAVQLLASLSCEQKSHLLASLCHAITIVARDTYGSDDGVEDSARLRKCNEMMHSLAGFLMAHLDHRPENCPDDAIVAIFLRARQDKRLEGLLKWEFQRTIRYFEEST